MLNICDIYCNIHCLCFQFICICELEGEEIKGMVRRSTFSDERQNEQSTDNKKIETNDPQEEAEQGEGVERTQMRTTDGNIE